MRTYKFEMFFISLFSKKLAKLRCNSLFRHLHRIESVENERTPCNSKQFGQPTFRTHPHLLQEDEIVPGIKIEEYKERRYKFMDLISKETYSRCGAKRNQLVIIPSATKKYMTERIPYFFRQNSDYLYLSGCQEPDTALVFLGDSPDNFTTTIFVRKSDHNSEMWDGPATGIEDAAKLFSVDDAVVVNDFEKFLLKHAYSYPGHIVYYDKQNSTQTTLHSIVTKHIKQHNLPASDMTRILLHKLRLTKSASEQKLMEQSCKIASEAIKKTMSFTVPGVTEHQLFTVVDYESRMRGAEFLAYPPVVASGTNANIIHYINNTQKVKDGDLILMDAGCEFHGYCSDITRVWPANGRFNEYQTVLYEVLLTVQKELIKLCEQKLALDLILNKMIDLLGARLKEAKVISNKTAHPTRVARHLCPHHVSHYLGMDVHDSASMPRDIPLQPGMVVTIEPGIYIRNESCFVAEEFRNLGLRIEDDVLITHVGYKVLTKECPKDLDEIQQLMVKD